MKYEELKSFKENVADPRMKEIFDRTKVPEGLCVINNLLISYLDGRNCGYDSMIEASGLKYNNGKVEKYSYEEMDVSVAEFAKNHKDCIFLLDGKLQVTNELQEMEIHTVMRGLFLSGLPKMYPELEELYGLNFDEPTFEWEKMKHLYSSELKEKSNEKDLDKQILNAKNSRDGKVGLKRDKDIERG